MDLETPKQDEETERTDTNTTKEINDDQPSEINQTSLEENKSISHTNESNELPKTRFIPASELSDPTLDSSEGNNSASLSNDSYKRGPTPSVFKNITREQSKKNLLEKIENIRKGYEYLCITNSISSDCHLYHFYSSINKLSPNYENYTIYVLECRAYHHWTF